MNSSPDHELFASPMATRRQYYQDTTARHASYSAARSAPSAGAGRRTEGLGEIAPAGILAKLDELVTGFCAGLWSDVLRGLAAHGQAVSCRPLVEFTPAKWREADLDSLLSLKPPGDVRGGPTVTSVTSPSATKSAAIQKFSGSLKDGCDWIS
jgi:hypothetical protein